MRAWGCCRSAPNTRRPSSPAPARGRPGGLRSLSAFDAKGRLIPSVTDRHTYTRDTTALSPNGTFTVSLSRDPESGNWLPVGGGGRLALVYTVIDLGVRAVSQDGEVEKNLPVIKRRSC